MQGKLRPLTKTLEDWLGIGREICVEGRIGADRYILGATDTLGSYAFSVAFPVLPAGADGKGSEALAEEQEFATETGWIVRVEADHIHRCQGNLRRISVVFRSAPAFCRRNREKTGSNQSGFI